MNPLIFWVKRKVVFLIILYRRIFFQIILEKRLLYFNAMVSNELLAQL